VVAHKRPRPSPRLPEFTIQLAVGSDQRQDWPGRAGQPGQARPGRQAGQGRPGRPGRAGRAGQAKQAGRAGRRSGLEQGWADKGPRPSIPVGRRHSPARQHGAAGTTTGKPRRDLAGACQAEAGGRGGPYPPEPGQTEHPARQSLGQASPPEQGTTTGKPPGLARQRLAGGPARSRGWPGKGSGPAEDHSWGRRGPARQHGPGATGIWPGQGPGQAESPAGQRVLPSITTLGKAQPSQTTRPEPAPRSSHRRNLAGQNLPATHHLAARGPARQTQPEQAPRFGQPPEPGKGRASRPSITTRPRHSPARQTRPKQAPRSGHRPSPAGQSIPTTHHDPGRRGPARQQGPNKPHGSANRRSLAGAEPSPATRHGSGGRGPARQHSPTVRPPAGSLAQQSIQPDRAPAKHHHRQRIASRAIRSEQSPRSSRPLESGGQESGRAELPAAHRG
jgi:hypothetical protein